MKHQIDVDGKISQERIIILNKFIPNRSMYHHIIMIIPLW